MNLVPFQTEMGDSIAGWPLDLAEAQAWGGRNTPFPVTAEVFIDWHRDSTVQPFVALEDDSLVAYGERWIDREEDEFELARIIVRPENRNAGIGQAFVRRLVTQALDLGRKDIYLRGVPQNQAARRCYQAAGFEPVSRTSQELFNRGQPVEYLWMKYAP